MQTEMLLLISICAGVAAAQQPRESLMAEVGRENLPAQRLGIDDLVAVSVYDAPEMSRTVVVEPDGTVHLPILKRGVKAEGRLPRELEASLTEALKDEQILVNPEVKVTVAEYHSRPISVMGAVRKPLQFQAVGSITVLDALARAEGLSELAGTEVLLTRGDSIEHISVKALINNADPAVNFELHGGEQLRVPEAGKIYVVGNVKKSGAFAVRDGSENSVFKLVAMAEGLAPYAYKVAYIYRPNGASGHQEIAVELAKILERKSPDVPLQVDDILYIPDSKGKRLTSTVLDRMAGFGASTASGVLIWH
jgi:polysaccharide export outer membrane protein